MTDDGIRWVNVLSEENVEPDSMLAIEVEGRPVAIYRFADGSLSATSNICTHAFAYLTDGWFEDGVIECPLHGGCFDARTGKGLCAPIDADLELYPLRVVNGAIEIGLR